MHWRHLEVAENQQKNEKIVDTERKLDHVSRDELQRGRTPVPEKNQNGKHRRQPDPECAPGQSFAESHRMGPAMEDAEIEDQHCEDEKVE